MKRKLLVIFFMVVFFSILIYKLNKRNDHTVLYIGEKDFINNINYDNKFLYDNITYKELINCIKVNDFIVVKGKNFFLNQLIMDADTIIISVNNNEYMKKCNKDNININYYYEKINKSKKELLSILKKITSAEIKIIENEC